MYYEFILSDWVRFWSKVEFTPTCWLWTAYKLPLGYGMFTTWRLQHGPMVAHRVAYMMLVGPIPEGLQLDHLCRNPSCVNPAHLEPVTFVENIARGLQHGPAPKTHCPQGHPYDETNPFVGNKSCRECGRIRARERARKKYGWKPREASTDEVTYKRWDRREGGS